MRPADKAIYAAKLREFGSDEAEAKEYRDALGAQLHANNLKLVTTYLHRKGLWRVRLNATCEVLEVVSGIAKGGPPCAGEFSFKAQDGGEMPSFGSLARLDAVQTQYAKTLIIDLQKVARARELAHQHQVASDAEGSSAEGARVVRDYLESMSLKAGALPPSRSQVREAIEQQEAEAARQHVEYIMTERRGALEDLGVSGGGAGGEDGGSLGDVLERERQKELKKAQKRARQKAKKKALASGAPVEISDGDVAASGVCAADSHEPSARA